MNEHFILFTLIIICCIYLTINCNINLEPFIDKNINIIRNGIAQLLFIKPDRITNLRYIGKLEDGKINVVFDLKNDVNEQTNKDVLKTIEYLIKNNKFRIIVNNKIIELNKYNDLSNIKESFEESENDNNLTMDIARTSGKYFDNENLLKTRKLKLLLKNFKYRGILGGIEENTFTEQITKDLTNFPTLVQENNKMFLVNN